ncbi:septation ring formation regulator EzrA [Alkalibacterium iburiense]|uniref:Septation ring formation regulator EzrA n=1 Tax=Alkalibacterium iburiense TaxID=290589 RepID=A0ABN0XIY8_9LACT
MPIEVIVTLIILLIAITLYILTYYLKKKNYSAIDELDKRKKEAQNNMPTDKAKSLDKMMITGQTKEMADKVLESINQIEEHTLPHIESLLFEAEQATDRYKFNQSKKYQEQANEYLSQMEEETKSYTQTIDELLQREQANLKKIEGIKKKYHEIRKELLAKSFSFGSAINKLEDKLGQMEKLFTSFSDLTASGDHEEAKKVVNQLDNRLNEMEKLMADIPPILKTIQTVYTEELKEIEEGHQQLVKQDYVFPEELSIEEEIIFIEEKIQRMNELISDLKVEETRLLQEETETTIDKLYDAMELEIEAKANAQKLLNQLAKVYYYVAKQDRELTLEMDRISQSYILFKDEEKIARDLNETLDEQKKLIEHIEEQLDDKVIPHSEADELLNKAFDQLEELSESYQSLSDVLYSYRKQELSIKADLEDMETDIREMKRYIESKHLPGLPNNYLDLLFYTTDHLEQLAKELARPKLDLEEVLKLHSMCEEDCDHLAEQTEIVVDNALLTELTSQRLYRHREEYPGIMETIRYSEGLFLNEYDYETALKMVREKLESIEPGAFEEVKSRYEKEKTYD